MAYIKEDGTIGYDTIFNVSVIQTDAEKAAIEAAEKKQRTDFDAKIAARQAVLDKLGLTADEAQALLGGPMWVAI